MHTTSVVVGIGQYVAEVDVGGGDLLSYSLDVLAARVSDHGSTHEEDVGRCGLITDIRQVRSLSILLSFCFLFSYLVFLFNFIYINNKLLVFGYFCLISWMKLTYAE